MNCKKTIRLIAMFLYLLIGLIVVNAEETPLTFEPYLYSQNFEDGKDPTSIWASNVKNYNINFKGVTGEKAFSGEKSFKCDVTYQGGHFFYLKLPLPNKLPAEGKLKFSARLFIGEESTGYAKLGGVYSGTIRNESIFSSACPSYGSSSSVPKGQWVLMEGDIVSVGNELMESNLWGLKNKEGAGRIYLDFLGIYLIGGNRVVVYIDDIKIEGEIPTEKAYVEMAKKRTEAFLKESEAKLNEWETALNKMRKSMESLQDEDSKKKYLEQINQLLQKVSVMKSKGFIKKKDYEEILNTIRELDEEVSFSVQ